MTESFSWDRVAHPFASFAKGWGKNVQPLMTHALFQHLHHRSRIAGFRFTDQKVEVLRHDHIAMDTEPVLLPRVFEYFPGMSA